MEKKRQQMKKLNFILLILSILVISCEKEPVKPIQVEPVQVEEPGPVIVTQEPVKPVYVHKFEWNHEYNDYFLVEAIKKHGPALLNKIPKDYKSYIKTWPKNEPELINFWGNILVKMAYYESKWKGSSKYQENFSDRNGNKIWSRGLFQLSIESGKGYKCDFKKESDLHVDSKNIECAVIILNRWVDRDGVIAGKVSRKWKGGARYWAVLRGFNTYTRKALNDIKNANSKAL